MKPIIKVMVEGRKTPIAVEVAIDASSVLCRVVGRSANKYHGTTWGYPFDEENGRVLTAEEHAKRHCCWQGLIPIEEGETK